MRIGAIIAEYNPFHNGHLYQIADFKQNCNLDFCAVIMSGNFVQRGEPAICDKRTRAYWALAGGADIVIELPVYYAVSNAQAFARGAVGTLAGIADVLGFGAETADTELLTQAARVDTSLIRDTHSGKTYPRAVEEWVQANCGAQLARVFSSPNCTLAIEYIRARDMLCPNMSVYAVKRVGTAHDSDITDGVYSSASNLRSLISEHSDIKPFVPPYVKIAKRVVLSDMDKLILHRLRTISEDELESVSDVREGLHKLIIREAMQCTSYSELLTRIKSKRYTMARLKRICLGALLGITQDLTSAPPEYLHVLGVRETARSTLIAEIQKRTSLDLLLRADDYRKYINISSVLLKTDLSATNTYSLFYDELPNSDFSNKLLIF